MVDVPIIKNRIIEVLKRRGPCLPIQIASEIKQNSIFTSAFLSELIDEKKIKISSLMVGGSHLYFLDGQEEQLEKFTKYLHPKEAEAFILLKNNKVLKDSEQEPAIRVALREIKDFTKDLRYESEIYWKNILSQDAEIIELIKTKWHTKKEIIKKEEKANVQFSSADELATQKMPEKETEPAVFQNEEPAILQKLKKEPNILKIKKTKEPEIIFNNPLVPKPVEKPKKEHPKSEFVLNVVRFLEEINFRIVEEKEHKLKEYLALVEVETPLGPITFLTQAKDKQTINDSDLQKLLSDAQCIPLPALMLYTGNLTKKALEYVEKYPSILKTKKIE